MLSVVVRVVPDATYVPLSLVVCGASVTVQVQVVPPAQVADWMVPGMLAMSSGTNWLIWSQVRVIPPVWDATHAGGNITCAVAVAVVVIV